MSNFRQSLCKHKTYKIIKCNKNEIYYYCMCEKCGLQFDKPKAKDEMYTVGSIIKTW